jgi:hypothetical protein
VFKALQAGYEAFYKLRRSRYGQSRR